VNKPSADSPQVLYRFWNADNELLYVGISSNFFARVGAHKNTQPWFSQVAYTTLEHFPNRKSVDAAETKAIRTEHPLHNKAKRVDYVPPEFHLKSIYIGSVYKHKRFGPSHGWMKGYMARYATIADRLTDIRVRRAWQFMKAYTDAREAGHSCPMCEIVYEADFTNRLYK
jgi:predicted GIY-YIG superfamily endonuclease